MMDFIVLFGGCKSRRVDSQSIQIKINKLLLHFIDMSRHFHRLQQRPTTTNLQFKEVRSSIDSLLQHDINLLRSSPQASKPSRPLKIDHSNQLIKQYISNNYQQYQIVDPLPHLSNKKHHQQTPIDDSSVKQSQLYSSIKPQQEKKIVIRLDPNRTKQKIRTQATEEKQPSTKYRTATQGTFRSDQINKKSIIGLKKSSKKSENQQRFNTDYSSDQKYLTKQFSIEEERSRFQDIQILESRYVTYSEKRKERYQTQYQQNANEPVSQTFRYCVGCQKAILEVNINYHQKTCKPFQTIMTLPIAQIVPVIDGKIIQYQKIIENCSQKEQQNNSFSILCRKLVNESQKCRKQGTFSSSFQQTQQLIHNNFQQSIFLLETLSKLSWFSRIRQNIWNRIK